MKKSKKTFTTLQYKIADLKEGEYDLLYSYGESQAYLFFILKDNFQGVEPK